jgi:hypothetical protein
MQHHGRALAYLAQGPGFDPPVHIQQQQKLPNTIYEWKAKLYIVF